MVKLRFLGYYSIQGKGDVVLPFYSVSCLTATHLIFYFIGSLQTMRPLRHREWFAATPAMRLGFHFRRTIIHKLYA
jgi:hypothetical protein